MVAMSTATCHEGGASGSTETARFFSATAKSTSVVVSSIVCSKQAGTDKCAALSSTLQAGRDLASAWIEMLYQAKLQLFTGQLVHPPGRVPCRGIWCLRLCLNHCTHPLPPVLQHKVKQIVPGSQACLDRQEVMLLGCSRATSSEGRGVTMTQHLKSWQDAEQTCSPYFRSAGTCRWQRKVGCLSGKQQLEVACCRGTTSHVPTLHAIVNQPDEAN